MAGEKVSYWDSGDYPAAIHFVKPVVVIRFLKNHTYPLLLINPERYALYIRGN
jgi:hypothetical protein